MTERMKAADFGRLRKKDRRRVRGTKPVTRHGIKFDSTREADRYDALLLLKKAGKISDLKRQVQIPLQGQMDYIRTPTGREMVYVADFQYVDHDQGGVIVTEDAKGYPTDTYKMKRAILAAMGIEVIEV